MNQRLPKTVLLGLCAAIGATILWAAEQTTGSLVFEDLTVPVKLVLLVTFPLFLPDLSSLLHARRRVALSFALTSVFVTTAAAAVYLPWRDQFGHQFSNDVYKWYYTTSSANHLSYPPDFDAWLAGWQAYRPHLLEFGILVGFYAIIASGCYYFHFRRLGGFVLAAIAYVYLLFVPIATGLIQWSYDTFLRGIAFDSISFDMHPFGIWCARDYSIFLYVFLLVFFGAGTFHLFRYATAPTETS